MPNERASSQEEWLTLQQAAALLGVHQNTLRRWADAGRVSVYRTPGGHRRFRRDVIRSLQREPSAGEPPTPQRSDGSAARTAVPAEQAGGRSATQPDGLAVSRLIDDTLQHTRGALQQPALRQQLWHFRAFGDAHVAARRESGRRLLGILLQLAAHPAACDQLLQHGRQIAREYGREARAMGLSSSELVRLWLAFRHIIVDSLAASERAGAAQANVYPLMHRIGEFFDDLLVESLEAYENALEAPGGTPRRGREKEAPHHADEELREA